MKAKRLCALLVAGLLSLAPAVTLTSCSGGGGGGGDLTVDEWPSSLAGRTVTAQRGNAQRAVIRFVDEKRVTVEYQNQTQGSRTYVGRYVWTPDENQKLSDCSLLDLSNTQNAGTTGLGDDTTVRFSIALGRLQVARIVLDFANGHTIFEAGQCELR